VPPSDELEERRYAGAGHQVDAATPTAVSTIWAAEGHELRDNGIGISPEDRGLIFEAFQQASVGTGALQEGTGLGLAIVKKLVELHGGTVSVESAPGEGSCFTVTLPVFRLEPS
jgi:signal transduction histidine kinase